MNSFTSLSHRIHHKTSETSVNAPSIKIDANGIKTAHTLPAGREIGVLLHAVLETIPLDILKREFSDVLLTRHVEKHIKNTVFSDWVKVIASIVNAALTAQMPACHGNFSVGDIDPSHCYREHEFVYGIDGGYVKGVIDFIFRHNDKYYIIDWKSNWLGPDDSCYTPEGISKAMEEDDYYLQAELYKEALKRYLEVVDGRDFNSVFGGVFYVFLRGLSPGTHQGVLCVN